MRTYLAAAAAVACMASTASAQQQASSFFTGVPANEIKFVPIDTSKVIVQSPGQSALTSNRFNFAALFNKRIVPSWPPRTGVSPLPPPSSFPSTHYTPFKMVGEPPYFIKWMFGDSDVSPIQPMKPFTPGTRPIVGPGS